MNKKSMNTFIRRAERGIKRNSNYILAGIGFFVGVASGVSAVRATPKVQQLIKKAEEEKGDRLTKAETVKVAWKPYSPAIGLAILSAGCMFGSNYITARRISALTAACKLSAEAYSEYKETVQEIVSEENIKEIKEKIADTKIAKQPAPINDSYIEGTGDILFLDSLSGRWFRSTIADIKNAESKLNLYLRNNDSASLNLLYSYFGLPFTDLGGVLGWSIDRHGFIDIDPIAKIRDDGKLYAMLDFSSMPEYDYDRY